MMRNVRRLGDRKFAEWLRTINRKGEKREKRIFKKEKKKAPTHIHIFSHVLSHTHIHYKNWKDQGSKTKRKRNAQK